jgi:hypothetical protein
VHVHDLIEFIDRERDAAAKAVQPIEAKCWQNSQTNLRCRIVSGDAVYESNRVNKPTDLHGVVIGIGIGISYDVKVYAYFLYTYTLNLCLHYKPVTHNILLHFTIPLLRE